ncbi:MAG: hypothetical protein ACRCV6_05025 [Formosimonas sp.]
MKVDVNGMPHTFLQVTHPDGRIVEYGLVPKEDGHPFSAGKIEITGQGYGEEGKPHESTFEASRQSISIEQYNSLMKYINNSMAKPPYYNVTGDLTPLGMRSANCTGWAVEGWEKAGLSIDALHGKHWNPYGQWFYHQINDLISKEQDKNQPLMAGAEKTPSREETPVKSAGRMRLDGLLAASETGDENTLRQATSALYDSPVGQKIIAQANATVNADERQQAHDAQQAITQAQANAPVRRSPVLS